MRNLKILIYVSVVIAASISQAAILIDESDPSHQDHLTQPSTAQPEAQAQYTNRTVLRSDDDFFADAGALKHKKKMGVSATFAGATGLLGTNLDMNIFQDFAVSVGGGVSRGFQALNVHVKQTFGGVSFQPYMAIGYSRWYSNGNGPVNQTSPGFVADKFLSASERASGRFAENIVYPAFGSQYLFLNGDLRGLGFFGEVLMLMDLNKIALAPTLGVGSIYYF